MRTSPLPVERSFLTGSAIHSFVLQLCATWQAPSATAASWSLCSGSPMFPLTPATPGGGWRHHPASSFEQMSRSHICDEAPESREGRCVEPSVPRAEVTQAVPSLSTAGSFLQPDTLSCMSASPSPTSLPLRHSHLCLPFTHISASLLPASCRSSLGILHELCDGHCVTSTAPPPTSPEPISTCAQLPDGCP